MMAKQTKYITTEYHEGQMAYDRGEALTSNPYLCPHDPDHSHDDPPTPTGALWYWMFGWQDAMADDVRSIKETIIAAATTHEPSTWRPH